MITYGLTKEYRYKLYMVLVVFSLLIEYTLYTFGISKIEAGEQWDFVVQLLLSMVSFSTIVSIMILLIDKLFLRFNKINGKYDIAISSSYNDNTTINATLKVDVGLLKAKIALETSTSKSISKTVFIDNQDKDNCQIVYTYHNNGNCYNGNELAKHEGTCILTFNKKELIEGYYYNGAERKTHGTFAIKGKINERKNKRAD